MIESIIRRARAERGLTQTQLAEISGVKQANISAIENGRRTPGLDTLQRLVSACGFELLAAAGDRVLAFPPPVSDAAAVAGTSGGDPPPEPPSVDRNTPVSERARMLTAALEASEAIVRAR